MGGQVSGAVSGPGTWGGQPRSKVGTPASWLQQKAGVSPGQPVNDLANAPDYYKLNGIDPNSVYQSRPLDVWQQSTAGQQPKPQPAAPIQGPAKPQWTIDEVKAGLKPQVDSKGITQAQADAEIARVQGLWDTYNKGSNQVIGPQLQQAQGFDLNKARADLQAQVNAGQIPQWQMDEQMRRNMEIASPAFPNTGMGTAASIANVQGGLNQQNMQQQAQYNRVDEFNPYGSSQYKQNPDGSYSRITSLSPEQQQLLDQQQGRDITLGGGMGALTGQGVGNLSQPFDYSGMPRALGMDDLQADRKRVEDTVYGTYEGDINRQFEDEQRQLEQRLTNMGQPRGGEMWQKEITDLSQRKQDALNRARSSAMMTSRGEMESMYDMSDRSRTRGIAEAKDIRYMPLDEVAKLGALQRGVADPSFSGISQIGVPGLDFGSLASNFAGQDYGLNIYKDKAAFDQQKAQEQYLWQKAQEKKGGGGGGGSSGGGNWWDVFG